MRIRVSRRTFLVQSSAASTAFCLPSVAWAQEANEDQLVFPDVSELVKQLPPQVRYVAPRVPDSQNGYLVFRHALDAVIGTEELHKAIEERLGAIDYDNWPYSLGMEEEPRYPSGAAREVMENWLDRNDRAYALVERASKYTKGAVPPKELEETFRSIFFSEGEIFPFMKVHSLNTVVTYRVLRSLEQGDSDGAMASIRTLWRLARMLRRTPGTHVQALHTSLMCRYAMLLMRVLARHPVTTEQQIIEWRGELARHDRSAAWMKDSLRLEFHYINLPLIHAFDEARGLAELSEVLIRFRGDLSGLRTNEPSKAEQDQTIRVLLKELLADHPKPFDTVATLEHSGRELLEAFEGLESGDVKPREIPKEIADANKLWPRELREAMGILTWDLDDLVEEQEDEEPLTPQAKAGLRAAFLKVDNPVGKLIFLRNDLLEYLGTADMDSLEQNLTEVILAGRLFWNRHNRVPHSLEELVSDKLLTTVPADPYGEGPLKYDPERGLVWSVMHNGVDDRGESADYEVYDPEDERDDMASPMPQF
jgi:hypothetical protein